MESTIWWCTRSVAGPTTSSRSPSTRDYLVAVLRRTFEMRELSRRVKQQQVALDRHVNHLEAIVEERRRELRETTQVIESSLRWLTSPNGKMQKILEQIGQVADSPLTV